MALQSALGQQQSSPAPTPEMGQAPGAAPAGPPPDMAAMQQAMAQKHSKAKRTARSHKKGVKTVKRRGRRGKKH